MSISRHLYAVGGIMAVLTAASFGTAHYKAPPPAMSNVIVANTPAQPIPVKDSSGHTPITIENSNITITDGNGSVDNVAVYTVPAGKRLIIQTLFGAANGPANEPIAIGLMKAGTGANLKDINFQLQTSPSVTGESLQTYLQSTTLSFEAGSPITISFGRTDITGLTRADFGFSGYLENAS